MKTINVLLTSLCLVLAVQTYACKPCFTKGAGSTCAAQGDNLCLGMTSLIGAPASKGITSGGDCGKRAPFYLFACGTGVTDC